MVLIEALDEADAAHAGDLVGGRDLGPGCGRRAGGDLCAGPGLAVLAAQLARLRVIDPELTVETGPGMS